MEGSHSVEWGSDQEDLVREVGVELGLEECARG